MTKNVCRRCKLGHCNFGDKCNIFDCEIRHPKICKYISFYGRCKFTTYCDYSHEKPNDVKENSEKINEIEKKL